MFNHLEIDLLRMLIQAEVRGKPLTYEECGRWVNGSTWEDLWAAGQITAQGQGFVATVTPSTPIVATDPGKERYRRNGK